MQMITTPSCDLVIFRKFLVSSNATWQMCFCAFSSPGKSWTFRTRWLSSGTSISGSAKWGTRFSSEKSYTGTTLWLCTSVPSKGEYSHGRCHCISRDVLPTDRGPTRSTGCSSWRTTRDPVRFLLTLSYFLAFLSASVSLFCRSATSDRSESRSAQTVTACSTFVLASPNPVVTESRSPVTAARSAESVLALDWSPSFCAWAFRNWVCKFSIVRTSRPLACFPAANHEITPVTAAQKTGINHCMYSLTAYYAPKPGPAQKVIAARNALKIHVRED